MEGYDDERPARGRDDSGGRGGRGGGGRGGGSPGGTGAKPNYYTPKAGGGH
jgi:hypothetical protein